MHDAVTRRSLIQRILLILGIEGLGLTGCVSSRSTDGASPPLQAIRESAPTSGALSRAEMDDLVALGEVLVLGGTLAPTERRYLVEHVQDRTAHSPQYLALYRSAASTLQRLAGERFARVPINERIDLIDRHRLVSSGTGSESDPGPSRSEMRTLRTRVVPDLLMGFYSSPAGWAVVDYETFPGRCGDLTRYTRAEA
jgi:hypothetical protein